VSKAIYPVEWAALTKERNGEKYRPSNGTEGVIFFAAWCCKCQRDKSMREGEDFDECDDNELCPIIADTMTYDVEDEKYPNEWQYDKNGQPCCTAYVCFGDVIVAGCDPAYPAIDAQPVRIDITNAVTTRNNIVSNSTLISSAFQ